MPFCVGDGAGDKLLGELDGGGIIVLVGTVELLARVVELLGAPVSFPFPPPPCRIPAFKVVFETRGGT